MLAPRYTRLHYMVIRSPSSTPGFVDYEACELRNPGIGASLAGLAGALIALPIAAAVKVVLREVWLVERTPAATPSPAASPNDARPPEVSSPSPGGASPSDSP
jgi:hypothetical protein